MPFSLSPLTVLNVALYGLTITMILVITLFINTRLRPLSVLLCVAFGALNTLSVVLLKGAFILPVSAVTVLVWSFVRAFSKKRRPMEIFLSSCVALCALIHYRIFLSLLSCTEDQALHCIGLAIYAVLTGGLLAVFLIFKVALFKESWVTSFFMPEEKAVRQIRYFVFLLLSILSVLTMLALSASVADGNLYLNLLLFFISIVILAFSFILVKLLVEYCIACDTNIKNLHYQQNLEAFMKVIRSQRHDFNVHLHAIKGLIDTDNFTECRKYIATMVKDSGDVNEVLPVHNPIISAMLHAFRENAESAGIHIEFDIHYNMKDLAVSAYDLNRILGNLIQNAMDEIKRNKSDDYGIQLHISKADNMTVIDISNRFDVLSHNFDNLFSDKYTTKRRHEGIGLNTILRITESYGGMVYPEVNGDIIHFIVRLPNVPD